MRKLAQIEEYVLTEFGRDPLYERFNAEKPHKNASWFVNGTVNDWADVYSFAAKKMRIVDRSHLTALLKRGNVIFEGAQGVLLDEWYGFHPHTTWSTTTAENPNTLICEVDHRTPTTTIGVVRALSSRHGEGPFPTFDANLTKRIRDSHNDDVGPQGEFKVGWFDRVLSQYALDVCEWPPLTEIMLTHVDRLSHIREPLRVATEYSVLGMRLTNLEAKPSSLKTDLVWQEKLTTMLRNAEPVYQLFDGKHREYEYLEFINESLGGIVTMISRGPTASDKVLFRA